MARVNLTLPDDLAQRVAAELPDLNVSGLLQRSLRLLLDECGHDRWVCATCTAGVDRADIEAAAAARLYIAAYHAIADLVRVCGTAEGAARLLRREGQKLGLRAANAPLPKPTQAEREHARVREFPAPPSAPAMRSAIA